MPNIVCKHRPNFILAELASLDSVSNYRYSVQVTSQKIYYMPSYLTQEGLAKAQEELKVLTTVRRKDIAQRIARAKELGDLSENEEYTDAKEEQAFIEGRILELEHMVHHATVVQKQQSNDMVGIGSRVKVHINGGHQEFHIVGANEADPINGKISHESPLGKAFLGKKKGDKILVNVPSGEMTYTVKDIA